MSIDEQRLLFQLRRLGLREGSGSFVDYEAAKKMLRGQKLPAKDFEKAIRITTNYLRCEL